MDINKLYELLEQIGEQVEELVQENEQLKTKLHNRPNNILWKSLREVLTDEEVVMGKPEAVIKEIVNVLKSEFNLSWIQTKSDKKAVIIATMDTSGSMGIFEKYIARCQFLWLEELLKLKYNNVEKVFITHHTEAKETDENSFYKKGEGGGTICSTALRKVNEVIERYDYEDKVDVFAFQFSDGDNLTSDNERCTKLLHRIFDKVVFMAYTEVNQYNRYSTLKSTYKHINHPKFEQSVIRERDDLFDTLKLYIKNIF